MKAIFCLNCGAKYSYSFAPPKFCSSCGESLSAEPKPSLNKKKAVKSKEKDYEEDEDEDEVDDIEIPDIKKIEVNVDIERSSSVTLGQILNSPPSGPVSPLNRNSAPTTPTLEEFLKKNRRGEEE